MPKHILLEIIFLYFQGLNCRKDIYELEDHFGEESLNSNLLLKFKPIKKIPPTSFPNRLLESV